VGSSNPQQLRRIVRHPTGSEPAAAYWETSEGGNLSPSLQGDYQEDRKDRIEGVTSFPEPATFQIDQKGPAGTHAGRVDGGMALVVIALSDVLHVHGSATSGKAYRAHAR